MGNPRYAVIALNFCINITMKIQEKSIEILLNQENKKNKGASLDLTTCGEWAVV